MYQGYCDKIYARLALKEKLEFWQFYLLPNSADLEDILG